VRPHTVHALAQFIRHTRGLLTTVEKWIANTPPEALHEEIGQVLFVARGTLNDLSTTLGTPRPPAAPVPAPSPTSDRPAAPVRPPDFQP
jgi:hypothetical protein